jgi:hypothetical protein
VQQDEFHHQFHVTHGWSAGKQCGIQVIVVQCEKAWQEGAVTECIQRVVVSVDSQQGLQRCKPYINTLIVA